MTTDIILVLSLCESCRCSIGPIPLRAWLSENTGQEVQGLLCILFHLSEFQSGSCTLHWAMLATESLWPNLFVTADLLSKWRETMSHEMESLLTLAGANADEREHFLYCWWIHTCAELDMNFNKTVIISHCTEAPWPLHENKRQKKNTMIFLEHRDILSAEQTWKRRHGMFQWKSFWHLVPLTQIICCHSNSWRLKKPDHNVRQRWRKKDLWLPKDTMARKSWLRVLLAIYHPWRGILKCLLCRGWGLGMSERVPRERRKIEDEVQLWQRCFPEFMPVSPPCSCLSFLTVRAWLQIKIEHYRQAGKKISA